MSIVLVTGGSGFVGSHVILQLLAAGHEVRTTVRSLAREAEVRETLAAAGATALDRLSFFAADLEKDDGWAEAAAGCEFVHHVASPFPLENPRHEDELIVPARDGTLRALRAARDAGVKRVVTTSSFAAVGYGYAERATPFTEADWTNLEGRDTLPYMKSKTIAERAAWDFIAREGGGMEHVTVNPVAIFGPALNADTSSSIGLIQQMMQGKLPGLPRLYFGVVDVRDVADLHLRAMTDPKAAGERFLAVAGPTMSMYDIALVLRREFGPAASKVTTRRLPDWMVKLVGIFDPRARVAVPSLGLTKQSSSAKARELLGWNPRSNDDALIATGESLLRLGLVE